MSTGNWQLSPQQWTTNQGSQENQGAQTSASSSPFAQPLGNFGGGLAGNVAPITSQLGSQIQSALQTGTAPSSMLPIVNRSTDSARAALSNSMSAARGGLASSGMANSTAGTNNLASLLMRGNQDIANIGPQTTQSFLQNTLPGMFGLSAPAVSALGGAGGLTQQTNQNVSQNMTQGGVSRGQVPVFQPNLADLLGQIALPFGGALGASQFGNLFTP